MTEAPKWQLERTPSCQGPLSWQFNPENEVVIVQCAAYFSDSKLVSKCKCKEHLKNCFLNHLSPERGKEVA